MKIVPCVLIFGMALIAQTTQSAPATQTSKGDDQPTIMHRYRGLKVPMVSMQDAYIAPRQWPLVDFATGTDNSGASHEAVKAQSEPGIRSACGGVDSAAKSSCLAAETEFYDSQSVIYKQGGDTYEFELVSAKWIFGMVLVLVAAGLGFASVQFYHALFVIPTPKPGQRGRPSASPSVGGTNELETDLEISRTGLKIRSSVIGLLLLMVSMAFFYLYIRYVYPIEETAITQPPKADVKAVAK